MALTGAHGGRSLSLGESIVKWELVILEISPLRQEQQTTISYQADFKVDKETASSFTSALPSSLLLKHRSPQHGLWWIQDLVTILLPIKEWENLAVVKINSCMQLQESPDISFYVRQDHCLIGKQRTCAVALFRWDRLISFHYSQAWNCQLYDRHLISDVLSASSHRVKPGVTCCFATLSASSSLMTTGMLREIKEKTRDSSQIPDLCSWSLLRLLTSVQSSPLQRDSSQPRACNPQHSAGKLSYQALVVYQPKQGLLGASGRASRHEKEHARRGVTGGRRWFS